MYLYILYTIVMSAESNLQKLSSIIDEYIKVRNEKTRSFLAKRFMDRTWVGYDDLFDWQDTEEADYYDIMVYHRLPDLSDWEVETTLDNIYSYWFVENWYTQPDIYYEDLVTKMIREW